MRELARRRGVGLTEAVKLAVMHELMRERRQLPLRDRLRAIVEPISAYRDTGVELDKRFFDELSGS